MSDSVFLSVIIPVYNTEKYVNKCVKSIINDSISDYELIIVDDGSTDNSYQICVELKQKYSNIVFISKKNGGLSSARNAGLNVAKGEYVAFVDSDDWVDTNMFWTVVEEARKLKYDIISYNIVMIEKNKKIINIPKDCGLADNYLFYPEYMHSACNKIIKKKLLDDNSLIFDEKIFYYEDLLFTFKAYMLSNNYKYVDRNVYYYNRNNLNSLTHEKDINAVVRYGIKTINRLKHFLNEKNLLSEYNEFIEQKRLFVAFNYINSNKYFNPSKFRRLNNPQIEWKNKSEITHRILCYCANRRLDLIPFLYVKILKKFIG